MNKLELDYYKTQSIYKELFQNVKNAFEQRIESLKNPILCSNCKTCCKIRYAEIAPKDIPEKILEEFKELFIPYGTDSWDNVEKLSIELNQKATRNVNPQYVDKVIQQSKENVYFYYCKHFEDENACERQKNNHFCKDFPNNILNTLPDNCGYNDWKSAVLLMIENEIYPEVYTQLNQMKSYREKFSCQKLGCCCKFASSEFSYKELLEKAKNNDTFAKEFTSVFVPYESEEVVTNLYPEFINLVRKKFPNDKIYFYYCPKLGKDNLCTDYENRPQVCRDFPSNPLVILPKQCGFKQWKDEVEIQAMLLHAMIEIIEFYKEKLTEDKNE